MNAQAIHYAIVGDGRLARHMRHYFHLLGQPCSGWARNPASPCNSHHDPDAAQRLRRTLAPAGHVLLLVSDDALAPLLRRYPWLHGHTLVHCAGALSLPGVAGVHPLMTFAGELYPLAQYQRIPFLVEAGHDFRALFPGLPNPHHVVSVEQKALYHALCVMAGNFPQLLWQQVAGRLQAQLGLPVTVLEPYLRQVVDNFIAQPEAALTGPLARGNRHTLQRNLAALEGDPLQAVYSACSELYQSRQAAPALREEAS
jgi:predicted short-subunit dehydrogenase-like oxidoreductase (DUF2520 family)